MYVQSQETLVGNESKHSSDKVQRGLLVLLVYKNECVNRIKRHVHTNKHKYKLKGLHIHSNTWVQ